MSVGGVDRATQIIGSVRRPLVGMAKEWLGDADRGGIAHREFGRDDLAEAMKVDVAAEFALRHSADAIADFLGGKQFTAMAAAGRTRTARAKRAIGSVRSLIIRRTERKLRCSRTATSVAVSKASCGRRRDSLFKSYAPD